MSGKEIDLEPIAEIVGIGIGRAADVLNTMLHSHVSLTAPSLAIARPEELEKYFSPRGSESLSAVEMEFSGDFDGNAQLVFASEDAGRLVDCITDDVSAAPEDLDSIRAGTLCEIGNIVINALLGSIVNVLRSELEYTVPLYTEGSIDDVLRNVRNEAEVIIIVRARFEIENLSIDGDLLIFLSLSAFTKLEVAIERFVDG
ncbi:MAG TPA: hypothetical protein VMV44_07870 [Rectinemataceae bacterium]|nr:hypothetical protein [Rectinemataceae bacterium]